MSETETTLTVAHITRAFAAIPRRAPGEFNGEIIESLAMVDGPFEDWSRVRSPGRARRRRRYRQNIRFYYTPKPDFLRLPDGTMVGHPQTVRAFYAKVREGMAAKSDEIMRNVFYGGPRP